MLGEIPQWGTVQKRLEQANKYEIFIRELATWNATTDSWYGLFQSFKDRANRILNDKR